MTDFRPFLDRHPSTADDKPMQHEPFREIVHRDPIWRDRTNFIIAAALPDEGDIRTEQLWVRQMDDYRFEICCIPFFVFDLSLADVVVTDRDYLVREVVRSSGRYVFRVWFPDRDRYRDPVVDDLTASGALLEWSSERLLAVDVVDRKHAQAVANLLAERQAAGQIVYETGRTHDG